MNLQDRILNRLQEGDKRSKKTKASDERGRARDLADRKEREERILSGREKDQKKKEAVRQARIINQPR